MSRRGHCEFFASAMAVMLRTQGIPARVVNGALAHSYNPVTGFYEVRAFDGHAWVEAYMPRIGWMTFEPTAAYPVPQREAPKGRALEELKDYTEKLARQESLEGVKSLVPTLASVLSAMNEAWQALMLRVRLLVDSLQAWISANAGFLLLALAGLGAILAIGYSQRSRVAWWLAQWVVRFSASPAVAIAAVRQIQRISPSKALRRSPGETIDEYTARLKGEFPDVHADLDTLCRAFNATRYGARAAIDDRAGIVAAFEAVGQRLSQA